MIKPMVLLTMASSLALPACNEIIVQEETFSFEGIDPINLKISSQGGALGSQNYELSVSNSNDSHTFFRGSGFREFEVKKVKEKLQIKMCSGRINEAGPFFSGSDRKQSLVGLDINWTCSDEQEEKT